MTTRHEPDVSRHVESTLEFLHEDLRLRELLALTYARAMAGLPAIDMVWSIFCGRCSPQWNVIHLSGKTSATLKILDNCLDAFELLSAWHAFEIEAAIVEVAASLQTPADKVVDLISHMVSSGLSGLPIGGLLEFLGKSQALGTLRRNTELFRSMNLIS